MVTPVDTFRSSLSRLIANFERDRTHYLSKEYLEAQARVDFITPLFEALGWDVSNKAGHRNDQREVVVERGESDTTGRPDYSFRVGGRTKFFVEAKAPSEPLSAPKHILQAKSYAWNTREVLFVVLTDFAEFRFYDASLKPDERKPDEGLLLRLTYNEFVDNVEKLWRFSREQVIAGSLEAMVPRDRRTQRLRIPVDEAFLDEMAGWREDLAKDIYRHNPDLAQDLSAHNGKLLNEVVQRLLDRIVFVRIAEDRHIIEKRQLADAVDEWKARGGKFHIFEWLNDDVFQRINEDFNGEIFKPRESDRIAPSSEALARIIERLYPPKSPYRFNMIGVELLGSIYERYLGKTLRPTAKQVRVENKLRHAGGVYYTPSYIVDRIVAATLGKAIEGKSPRQIEKLRVIDPACGSGSFLIGAFQCLIEYHTRWYLEHPETDRSSESSLGFMREVQTDADGTQRLSVYRKVRILRNNLYGVDIDPQAMEITMMSLYLKALEGERSQLPPKQHILPELKYNIICGNSLIDTSIYKQGTLFGDEERDRINAFDWQSAFGEIMDSGGFDVVIGNPPYIRVQELQKWAPFEVEFYKGHYAAAGSGSYDIYVVFVEKGLALLNKTGVLGFILPHKFFNAKYGEPLRALLAKGRHLSAIVNFGDQQIFEGATNYTCLLFLRKAASESLSVAKVDDLEAWRTDGTATTGVILSRDVTSAEWNFAVGKGAALFRRLSKMPIKLAEAVSRIYQGPITSADPVYLFEKSRSPTGSTVEVYSNALEHYVKIESAILKRVVRSGSIHRYFADATALVLFPYDVKDHEAKLLSAGEFAKRYPLAWSYLTANRRTLADREGGDKFNDEEWYRFGRTQNLGMWEREKLMIPYMVTELSAYLDEADHYYFINVTTGGYGITVEDSTFELAYLCGLLNSTLLDFYIKNVSTNFHGGYFAANKQYVEQLPIRAIDPSDKRGAAKRDRVVELVAHISKLSKVRHSGRLSPSQAELMDRDILSARRRIDSLVYDLYEVTAEERATIEAN